MKCTESSYSDVNLRILSGTTSEDSRDISGGDDGLFQLEGQRTAPELIVGENDGADSVYELEDSY